MRRKALASILAVGALSITAAPAFADPDFGPGNSKKGPDDGGAKCHARPDGGHAGLQVGSGDGGSSRVHDGVDPGGAVSVAEHR